MAMFTPRARNFIHVPANGGASAVIPAASPIPAMGVTKSNHAQMRYIFAAYALVVGGSLLGWGLDAWRHPVAPVVVQGLSVFAALYVAAQTIERAVEPITEWTGTALGGVQAPPMNAVQGKTVGTDSPEKVKSQAELKYRRALAIRTARSLAATPSANQPGGDAAAQPGGDSPDPGQDAANVAASSQAAVEQNRRNSAVFVWGIASFLGIVVSGWIGLALLHSVGIHGAPRVLDIIVTGLAIGGGSKPLHDFISNLQASKDAKKDPAEVKPQDCNCTP
jgi:hypothetical protein